METAEDVAAYLLAGANVVMTASALLRHGPEHTAVLLHGLTTWMARKGFQTIDQFRRMLAVPADTDKEGYERASNVSVMRGERPCIQDVLSRGGSQPWRACSKVRSRSCGTSVVAARRYVRRGNTDATAQFERFRSLALSPTHGES